MAHNEGLNAFRRIEPSDLDKNVFSAIGKQFMEVVVADKDGGANAMTASWGGLGVMWNLPVAFVVIRGEEFRYTRTLIDAQPCFSLCFLGEGESKAKAYLGTTHGWDDADKIGSCGLTTGWCAAGLDDGDGAKTANIPYIAESELVLTCEKLCTQELPRECFIDERIWESYYAKEGPHRLYIAAIKGAYVRDGLEA